MANTTNFGWETPDDTDLVKDGAAAIRTLGSSIDTSLVDLKGGTTGQILSKASNTDLDYTWINNDQGDITAVNTTAPLQGGGTSGALTLSVDAGSTTTAGVLQLEDSTSSTSTTKAATPNSVKTAYDLANGAIAKSIVDAKGDIIAATADNTVSRLAVGSNNQILMADSTTATGLKWGTLTTGGMTLLSTTTLTGASVTISSISGSYTDLVISVTGVTNNTAQNQLNFTVNNSATNYSFGHEWSGGTYTNWSGSGNLLPLTAFNRNVNANHLVVHFPRYSLSGVLRVANLFGYYRNNNNSAYLYSGTWGTEDTGAISSITLSNPGGTFASGTVRIYGVS